MKHALQVYEDWERSSESLRNWAGRLGMLGVLLGLVAFGLYTFGWQINIGGGGGEPMPLPILLFIASIVSLGFASSLWTTWETRRGLLEESDARVAVDEASEDVSGPDDLLGLMRLNKKQMDAYDVIARRHGASSHRASLAAMASGLVMMGIGLAIAWFAPEPSTKYSATIIAATATAAGTFIAQTFIRVQRDAQAQMQFYFRQPLVHSYLLMAERLAVQLPKEAKDKHFGSIIDAALNQAGALPAASTADTEAPPSSPAGPEHVPEPPPSPGAPSP